MINEMDNFFFKMQRKPAYLGFPALRTYFLKFWHTTGELFHFDINIGSCLESFGPIKEKKPNNVCKPPKSCLLRGFRPPNDNIL